LAAAVIAAPTLAIFSPCCAFFVSAPAMEGDAAEHFGHVARLVRRERHAAVLVAEGADDAAAGGQLGVGPEPPDESARRPACTLVTEAVTSPLPWRKSLAAGTALGDLAEVELREADGAGEGVRPVADTRLEGELAASAQRAFRQAAGELRQAQAGVLSVSRER
jgi:hypothetical protein